MKKFCNCDDPNCPTEKIIAHFYDHLKWCEKLENRTNLYNLCLSHLQVLTDLVQKNHNYLNEHPKHSFKNMKEFWEHIFFTCFRILDEN